MLNQYACSTRGSTARAHGCFVRACLCHCCGHPWCYPGSRPDRILRLRLCWPTSVPQVTPRPPMLCKVKLSLSSDRFRICDKRTHFAGTDGVIGLIPAGDSGVDSDTFRYLPQADSHEETWACCRTTSMRCFCSACTLTFVIQLTDAFALSVIYRRYFLECPEGDESPFAEPITTALTQLPSPEDQAAIVSSSRNDSAIFEPASPDSPLNSVGVTHREDLWRGRSQPQLRQGHPQQRLDRCLPRRRRGTWQCLGRRSAI